MQDQMLVWRENVSLRADLSDRDLHVGAAPDAGGLLVNLGAVGLDVHLRLSRHQARDLLLRLEVWLRIAPRTARLAQQAAQDAANQSEATDSSSQQKTGP